MGVVALADADLDDVLGVALRSLYEQWLMVAYVLSEDPDVSVGKLVEHQKWQDKHAARGRGDDVTHLDDGSRIDLTRIAARVSDAFAARGREEAEFARRAQMTYYRMESSQSVHAGLGSIEGHVAVEGTSIRILRRSATTTDRVCTDLLFGVMLLVSAAHMTWRQAGLPSAGLDELAMLLEAL